MYTKNFRLWRKPHSLLDDPRIACSNSEGSCKSAHMCRSPELSVLSYKVIDIGEDSDSSPISFKDVLFGYSSSP